MSPTSALHLVAGTVDLGTALGVGGHAGVATQRVAVVAGHRGATRLAGLSAPALILEGAFVRTVRLGQRTAALLHGPGDVVPSSPGEPSPFLARLRPLTTGAVAVLDADAMAAVSYRPLLFERLLESIDRQTEMLMLQAATSQLPSVSERLAVLLPILAERWGSVNGEGVILPAFLSHTVLAELIGVRRPSLTTALAELGDGTMRRLDDRRWLVSPAVAGLAA